MVPLPRGDFKVNLTMLDRDALEKAVAGYRRGIAGDPLALAVFERIAACYPEGEVTGLATSPDWMDQADALVESFGMKTARIDPNETITYDGLLVAAKVEPCVVIHEVGHYQCAAPSRRHVADFGLGPGVVTGEAGVQQAKKAQTVFEADADTEEALASLLGILWEAELGQPALLFFLDQEWLEGGPRGRDSAYFIKVAHWLRRWDLIDDRGRPTRALRQMDDESFFKAWELQPA